MGDLPMWKVRRIFKVMKNTQIFLKWSYYNGRPAQMKNSKIFQRGKKYKGFSRMVSL
jgi:hypothetical protein